jgi:hypothetical protein
MTTFAIRPFNESVPVRCPPDLLILMNYRRGFQRIYGVLVITWIVALLYLMPAERVNVWRQVAVVRQGNLMANVPPPPKGYEKYVDVSVDTPTHVGQETSRSQKALWLAGVLFAPPVLGYVAGFLMVPWVYRGFRPSAPRDSK